MRQRRSTPDNSAALVVALATGLHAQIGGTGADGALVVSSGTVTLDTSTRPGGFDFTTITVAAKGREAQAAMDAITELLANKFGEEEAG